MEQGEIKKIIEAMLFISDKPLAPADLKRVFGEDENDAVKSALADLKDEYAPGKKGVYLEEVAGGIQMFTESGLAPWIKKLFVKKTVKLSGPSLETLAVIAYKQPVTKAEIEVIRGVNVDGVLKSLLERDLIKITGRKDVPGRPLLYGTTSVFLDRFGLKSLRELPHPRDFKESDILVDDRRDILPINDDTGMAEQDNEAPSEKVPEEFTALTEDESARMSAGSREDCEEDASLEGAEEREARE